jgi:hypothetical protein
VSRIGHPPSTVVCKDRKSCPAQRSQSLSVTSRRDAERARKALAALPEGVRPTSLLRAEERAREAGYKARRQAADVASPLTGPDYELRMGDLNSAWDDLADGSIDAIVTDHLTTRRVFRCTGTSPDWPPTS